MDNKALAVNKINLKAITGLIIATVATMLAMLISSSINFILWLGTDGIHWRGADGIGNDISPANAFLLLPLMASIGIPAYNFRRVINLGGKRSNFFSGTAITYVILAVIASLLVTISNFTIEPLLERSPYFNPDFLGGIVNLTEVFGWDQRGFIIAFVQLTAFSLLFAAFVHTLTSAQGKWYGWLANITIIAVISVFTPIPVLRRSLVWFFNLIIFHQNALIQIVACLALAAGVYALSRPILARKTI